MRLGGLIKRNFGTVSGRKKLEAYSGSLLLLFLLEHLCGNILLLNSNQAPYLWYTEVMGNSLIVRVLEIALLGTFALHITVGLYMRLNYLKLKKRVVNMKPPKSISSRFVGVTGAVILLFLIVHLWNFFIPNRVYTNQDYNLYEAAHLAFSSVYYTGFYVFCMTMLAYHLHHGIRSAFATVKPLKPQLMPRFISVVSMLGLLTPLALAYICVHLYARSN
ncbi:MAG: hypothetical protein HQ472_01495 [Ignavibacteria bacterium]|nr:hypothetical protein [Ignavibacteria bacterium]